MSAFVVSEAHINALACAMIYGPTPRARWHRIWSDQAEAFRTSDMDTQATLLGRLLLAENFRSVDHRYPAGAPSAEDRAAEARLFVEARTESRSLVELLKAVSCYEYQACEHPGWEGSQAARLCEALRGQLIAALPGWEAAPWGIR